MAYMQITIIISNLQKFKEMFKKIFNSVNYVLLLVTSLVVSIYSITYHKQLSDLLISYAFICLASFIYYKLSDASEKIRLYRSIIIVSFPFIVGIVCAIILIILFSSNFFRDYHG